MSKPLAAAILVALLLAACTSGPASISDKSTGASASKAQASAGPVRLTFGSGTNAKTASGELKGTGSGSYLPNLIEVSMKTETGDSWFGILTMHLVDAKPTVGKTYQPGRLDVYPASAEGQEGVRVEFEEADNRKWSAQGGIGGGSVTITAIKAGELTVRFDEVKLSPVNEGKGPLTVAGSATFTGIVTQASTPAIAGE